MNKQEITTNQNNDQAYQEYYERKRIAMVMEENNNSKIIAIPSLNKIVREDQLGQLKKDIHAIEEYLSFIGLTLHPKKRVLKESKYGIPFLGATVYHDHITPSSRLIKNAKRAMQEVVSGARTIDSVPSYLGHFKYFNSYNILKEIFDETGWDYIPDDLFRTNFQKTRKSPESDDFLFPYLN